MENITRNASLMDDNIFDQEDTVLKNARENSTVQENKVSETSVRDSVSGVKLSPTPSMIIFDVELDNSKPKESNMVEEGLKSNKSLQRIE
uniref:Uncharacterized protein n=1 Tax=Ditylenchus dipsaci TaxID=166011 RepID=A0A915ERZ6_9BILA